MKPIYYSTDVAMGVENRVVPQLEVGVGIVCYHL